ncbi:hypothetical protein [Succinivibrio dextrinosolvens]|uniref:hypothetical protein n=1 Tax=Succinivibrio dextrinosolvens TaxID=83771 RepID=UPI001920933F|nr:hypothetical protein [Succinivibrio dextrinosolvens]MBE6422897.1 hypothetical protein [Succinivibrio dextrinosolvens]
MANELQTTHQKVQNIIEKDRERAERRKEAAIKREERISREYESIPTQVNARNSTLISKKIKFLPQDMIIKIPLDNPRIKIVAFDNCEHVGNATFAITAVLPITSKKHEIVEYQKALSLEFKKDVIDVVQKMNSYAQKILKNTPSIDLDNVIVRTSEPIKYVFRSRTPSCSQFLNWCGQADVVGIILLKLAHMGFISETEYMNRILEMANGLQRYCNFVYDARKKAFEKMAKITSANDDAKQELDQIKEDLKTSSNLELKDNGEITEKADDKTA